MNEPNKKMPFAEPKQGSRRVVVMGGSFNPPTLAHLRLMRAAVDALGAEKGIFVPSNHAYVERKMRRQRETGSGNRSQRKPAWSSRGSM